MSTKTFTLSEPLYQYLIDHSLRESPLLKELREETAKLPLAQMQIAPEQGQFMALLVKLIGARRCLEVGVFTGYSSLCIVAAMPREGRLIACDVSEEWTRVARRYWERAQVAERIELKLAPAVQTLDELLNAGQAESFDFIFIDADKENYPAYYERALKLARRNGLLVIDNTLWSGKVAESSARDGDTRAIRAFNQLLKLDERIDISLLPIADGVTLARKR